MSSDVPPTPPVPPSEHRRVPELDEMGSRIIDRERQDTECPQCRGTIYYVERATGETMMAFWDFDEWDSDEYRLSETYERTERYHECERCGWRIDL